MIPFQIEKLVVEHVWIKMVSTALGGMATIIDVEETKNTGTETFKKIKIPHQLASAFRTKYKVGKYITPVLSAMTFYDGHVVAIERHPLGNLGKEKQDGVYGEVSWVSDSEMNLDNVIVPLSRKNDFLVDGTFLYTLDPREIDNAIFLSKDGKFKAIRINAIKLQHMSDRTRLVPEERTALAFYPTNGTPFFTSPIWKTLTNLGSQQFSKMGKDEINEAVGEVVAADIFRFDEVDEHLSVNLGFALKAGRELSSVFGYDVIEPLNLDNLMIQMRTVNLPTIANEVKQTYDTALPFTHAVAWLIGLVNRTNTLESYMTVRQLLKYLTTKGVYRRGAFVTQAIFKDPNVVDVPLMSKDDAEKMEKIDFDTFLQMGRIARSEAPDEVDAIEV